MLVAVTQRVEIEAKYRERRDCLDQRWNKLLQQFGIDAVPVPNTLQDVSAWTEAMHIGGVVLSGGNSLGVLGAAADSAPERDTTEAELLSWAARRKVPVLGVCRGMQMMNHYCGGSLAPIDHHAGTAHEVILAETEQQRRQVNSFHNFCIPADGLAPCFHVMAHDNEGNVEAMRHTELPWQAIMWHPERDASLHDDDRNLLVHLFKERD